MPEDVSAPTPLQSADPLAWDRLIEALGPASMIAAIAASTDAATRTRIPPEDLWQETLLLAWRNRAEFVWQGLTSFRRWLLQIAANRLRNWIEHDAAAKRGGGPTTSLSVLASTQGGSASCYAGPIATTTPSRVASDAEQAGILHEALASLPDDLREVVRLRLFEGLLIEDVAQRLALGESAVRHRLRKGAELFEHRLRQRGAGSSATLFGPASV